MFYHFDSSHIILSRKSITKIRTAMGRVKRARFKAID